MKYFYSLLLTCALILTAHAQYNVTFQVDMGAQTVSANGVHVAGNFQDEAGFASDWDPASTALTLSSGTIYTKQVTIPAGSYEFKFINDNAWAGVESVPAPAQVGLGGGNDNRWMVISSDTVLPAVMFSGAAPSGMRAISMAVDMSTQASIDDTVSVAGNFFSPAWTPGAIRMVDLMGDSIYRYIGYAASGSTAEFKFLNGTAWSLNENVPASCAMNGNRYNNGSNDTIYGPVCFGQCISCFIPDTFNITLQVDMNNVCGWTSDSVDFAGPFNGWGGGDYLTDPDNDGIYTVTIRAAGGDFEYKARFIEMGSANWEGGSNKIVKVSSDTVVPVRCFGEDAYGACTPKPNPSDITFMVDMRDTVPASDIYLIGDFTSPMWQNGGIKMDPVAGTPGVYETTVTGICPRKISYKYVNGIPDPNDDTNEESFSAADSACTEGNGLGGFNRYYVRLTDQPVILGYKFNTCESMGIGLDENFNRKKFDIFPNPFNGTTTIKLEDNQVYSLSLSDINGKELLKVNAASGLYTLQAGNLAHGVYFLKVTNAQGEVSINKVLVN